MIRAILRPCEALAVPAVLSCLLVISLIGCSRDVGPRSPQGEVQGRMMLTPLMRAAGNGDLSSVEDLIVKGANVNAADSDGYTALHYAAHCGDVRVVQALIAAGANVNSRTSEGVTPLINSINMACGKSAVSLALIQAGTDVNAAQSDGVTALWIATTESSLGVMEALLKQGADPNVRSRSKGFAGDTPLHLAAINGLYDAAALLLKYGADDKIRNGQGKTALDVVSMKSAETKDLLTKRANQR